MDCDMSEQEFPTPSLIPRRHSSGNISFNERKANEISQTFMTPAAPRGGRYLNSNLSLLGKAPMKNVNTKIGRRLSLTAMLENGKSQVRKRLDFDLIPVVAESNEKKRKVTTEFFTVLHKNDLAVPLKSLDFNPPSAKRVRFEESKKNILSLSPPETPVMDPSYQLKNKNVCTTEGFTRITANEKRKINVKKLFSSSDSNEKVEIGFFHSSIRKLTLN